MEYKVTNLHIDLVDALQLRKFIAINVESFIKIYKGSLRLYIFKK